MIVPGMQADYEVIVGLEIHAQVKTSSKLFSGAPTTFGAQPNANVSLVDAALPGTLPILNLQAVRQAVKTGIAINATINNVSRFDRKNYFYADLPQGYQITQFYKPIVENGYLTVQDKNGEDRTIRIERIHLEQDAGKLIHDQSPYHSYLDLNRAGVALMEIVSKPDFRCVVEVTNYIKSIREILRAINASDGDMEKGSLRCDANVSVRAIGARKLGTRCEIKNLNSMKNIAKAIEYEAVRQVRTIESGEAVRQQTRLFDANTGETRMMRDKENAQDYRYFPDPDLLDVTITNEEIEAIRASMPELPDARRKRYIETYGISAYDANVLTQDVSVSEFFETVVHKHDPKLCCTWICSELFGRLNKAEIELEACKVTAANMVELLDLITCGEISGKMAKELLDKMFETGKSAKELVQEMGVKQITNESDIEEIAKHVLQQNPSQLEQFKAGNQKLFGYFVGEVMKATKGAASPSVVNSVLKKLLLEVS